jgi:hypothetical protein
MAHNLQERYSALVDVKLRAKLVTKDHVIFNTRYDGNPIAGAVNIPVRDGEVAVQDYNPLTGVSLTNGDTNYIKALINKDKAVNELIDGYQANAVPDNLVADRLDSAGYSTASAIDNDALQVLGTAHTATYASTDPRYGKKATTAKVSADNPFGDVTDAGEALDLALVPSEGRYVIVSPSFYKSILNDKDNFIKKGDLSQRIVETGAVGEIGGFTVYRSARLPEGVEAVFGHPDFATRVDEWSVPVHLQDLAGSGKYIGASAVQGRMVYTHVITKPQAFHVLTKA